MVQICPKVEVRNIGGQKSNWFPVSIKFDNRLLKNVELQPLAPGESKMVDFASILSPNIKWKNAEFHTLHVMAASNEYAMVSQGLWIHNDLTASIRYPDYWNSGLVVGSRNELYLGRRGRMSEMIHNKKLELLIPDQVLSVRQVGSNRYKIDFSMDFTVRNLFPVAKTFYLQSQKSGKVNKDEYLYFWSDMQEIGPREQKTSHAQIRGLEVVLGKEYKVEFRVFEYSTMEHFGTVESKPNPDFILNGTLKFRKRP